MSTPQKLNHSSLETDSIAPSDFAATILHCATHSRVGSGAPFSPPPRRCPDSVDALDATAMARAAPNHDPSPMTRAPAESALCHDAPSPPPPASDGPVAGGVSFPDGSASLWRRVRLPPPVPTRGEWSPIPITPITDAPSVSMQREESPSRPASSLHAAEVSRGFNVSLMSSSMSFRPLQLESSAQSIALVQSLARRNVPHRAMHTRRAKQTSVNVRPKPRGGFGSHSTSINVSTTSYSTSHNISHGSGRLRRCGTSGSDAFTDPLDPAMAMRQPDVSVFEPWDPLNLDAEDVWTLCDGAKSPAPPRHDTTLEERSVQMMEATLMGMQMGEASVSARAPGDGWRRPSASAGREEGGREPSLRERSASRLNACREGSVGKHGTTAAAAAAMGTAEHTTGADVEEAA